MSDVESATGTPSALALRRDARIALLIVALAAIVVAFILLSTSRPRWSSDAASILWPAASFKVMSGQAQLDDGRMIVRQAGPAGSFIAVLPAVQFDAVDYGAIEIRVKGLADDQRVAVLWRKGIENGRTYTKQAATVNAELLRVPLEKDPNWSGRITELSFAIVGPVKPSLPLEIESVRAVTVSAKGIVSDTARGWLAFEKWNGQSINVVLLGADAEPVSLPLFVAATTVVALAVWIFLAHRRPRRAMLVGAIAIVAAGWLVLDLRWILNLGQQTQLTAATYAGKTWREKQLAADDHELYRFIERARVAIAQHPGRVFFTSDFAYFRARGGYHLLPLNAVSNVYHRELYDSVYYRPGDYLCFFARSGIVYDASAQMLSWDGKPAVHAERIGTQGFGALYRVLG